MAYKSKVEMIVSIDNNAERVPTSSTGEDAPVLVAQSEAGLFKGAHASRTTLIATGVEIGVQEDNVKLGLIPEGALEPTMLILNA